MVDSDDEEELTIRERFFEVLERGRRGTASQVFDLFIIAIILFNVLISIIDTVPEVNADYGDLLHWLDAACVVIFVLEYLGRLWVAPENPMMRGHGATYARLRTMGMPLMVVDLLAIMPFFIELAFGLDVAAVRVIRIIRFYRLARYVPAIATIGRVLAAEWRALMGSAVVFAGLLLLSSVAMYVAEGRLQPDKFGDLPSTMWWAFSP